MDVRPCRQLGKRHSVFVAELPNCLPESRLLPLVLSFHATILDYRRLWMRLFELSHIKESN